MYHLLIRVTKAVKDDPHKHAFSTAGGPSTQSGELTRLHDHLEQLMESKLEAQYTKIKQQMDTRMEQLEQRMNTMMADQMARLAQMMQPRTG
uniref:Uncharacterized protein n=1 Tax=Mycena chlorophos TaxID=658473 RepID=A0ABQ0M7S1_MYCCL|nr:predicted protein [Mycena chlorophos]